MRQQHLRSSLKVVNNYIRNPRLRLTLRCCILSQAHNDMQVSQSIKKEFAEDYAIQAKQIWQNTQFILEEIFIGRRQPPEDLKNDKTFYYVTQEKANLEIQSRFSILKLGNLEHFTVQSYQQQVLQNQRESKDAPQVDPEVAQLQD